VSVIARRLGASSHGQLFGVLVAATIPMGILQASGTQNDYVTTFWLVVLAEAVLAPPSGWRTFQMGAGMGLALLSKGTAILFAPALLLALPELTAGAWSDRLRPAVPILLLVLALNAPHWARNTATFGWPLGPRDSGSADGVRDKLTNDALTPGIFASNVVRNLSLHAGIGHPGVDRAVQRATEQLHRLVGLDVEDPRAPPSRHPVRGPGRLTRPTAPATRSIWSDGPGCGPGGLVTAIAARRSRCPPLRHRPGRRLPALLPRAQVAPCTADCSFRSSCSPRRSSRRHGTASPACSTRGRSC
jgi:4-amino-4-deoxy-L-arabinose transferase-like glycosyltransferase